MLGTWTPHRLQLSLYKTSNRNTCCLSVFISTKTQLVFFQGKVIWFIMWHFTLWFPPRWFRWNGNIYLFKNIYQNPSTEGCWPSGWLVYTFLRNQCTLMGFIKLQHDDSFDGEEFRRMTTRNRFYFPSPLTLRLQISSFFFTSLLLNLLTVLLSVIYFLIQLFSWYYCSFKLHGVVIS